MRADRLNANHRTGQLDVEGFLPLTPDRQLDITPNQAAHFLDRLRKGHPLNRIAIEVGDQVARLQAGARRRGIVDRRDHLDEAVLHRHLDPEPAELAAGLNLHIVEVLRVQIIRMRVERSQHAVDRRLDQSVVADFVDIFGAYALEDLAEQIELLVGFRRVRRRCCADVLAQREHDDRRGDHRNKTRTLHPFTLSSRARSARCALPMISGTPGNDQAEAVAAKWPGSICWPESAACRAAADPINEWPVIAVGFGRPMMSSNVGAMSERRPFSRCAIAAGGFTTTNGTGLSVCAVCGSPVSGSRIISALPWSAVRTSVPPACSTASDSRPRQASTVSTALVAASIRPVCPTMSVFA